MELNFKLSELLDFLYKKNFIEKIESYNNEIFITGFSALSATKPNTLSWTKSNNLDLDNIKASVIICPKDFASDIKNIFFIRVEKPRQVFAKILEAFYPFPKKEGIETTAKISISSKIGKNSYIGHYVVIGENVEIGDNTIIYSNVSIYDNVKIGSNCLINSGVVIGADGFGYEKDENDNFFKFPHIGSVIIEDNVEIGSNTCIDRGVLADTIIKNNVKIDNLCHIAHNVEIEENSVVIALSMVAGSCKIEKNSWIAPGAMIKNGISVGKNSLVGLGAVVVKNVPENDIVAGVPAKSIKK